MPERHDSDLRKGAVEQDAPNQHTNTSLEGQLDHGHRAHPLAEGQDSDFPEPGDSPEHSGQLQDDEHAEGADQDPGHRQKQNQNQPEDDPLAA